MKNNINDSDIYRVVVYPPSIPNEDIDFINIDRRQKIICEKIAYDIKDKIYNADRIFIESTEKKVEKEYVKKRIRNMRHGSTFSKAYPNDKEFLVHLIDILQTDFNQEKAYQEEAFRQHVNDLTDACTALAKIIDYCIEIENKYKEGSKLPYGYEISIEDIEKIRTWAEVGLYD